MKHEPREVWLERVRRWEASGLSGREFATQEGVSFHTLCHWKVRLRAEGTTASRSIERQPARAHFVEVVASSSGAATPQLKSSVRVCDGFEVALANGRVLRIPANFEPAGVRNLLSILEGC